MSPSWSPTRRSSDGQISSTSPLLSDDASPSRSQSQSRSRDSEDDSKMLEYRERNYGLRFKADVGNQRTRRRAEADDSVLSIPLEAGQQMLDSVGGYILCSVDVDAQAGIKDVDALNQAWDNWSLGTAYAGLYLMAFVTSLESQTTSNLTVFATSAFGAQALISTILVIQSILNSVVKPPMAKVADVFGRAESFSLSILLYVLGYVQQAASGSMRAYATAQIFYSAGSTGLQILQQIFIADTSSLANRALFSILPSLPFLVTTWIGSPIAQSIVRSVGWRWGYGIWAVVLPVSYIPLALSLFLNKRRARKMGIYPVPQFRNLRWKQIIIRLWYELDFFGLCILAAGASLLLVPLTIAATVEGGWHNPNMVAMVITGVLCLLVFPIWEKNKTLAPHAFFPKELFQNRTALAGSSVAFFYFMAYYMSVEPYFYSYLLVVHDQSIATAGHITLAFSFVSTITAICVSFIIKFTGYYKHLVILGSFLYMFGLVLMIKLGAGGGMLNVPAQLGVQASVGCSKVAAATAVFLAVLEIGGAVGSAISGAIWSSLVPKKLALYLPADSKDHAVAIYESITLAADTYPKGTDTRNAIDRAYQETMTTILTIGICVCVPAIVASLFMENYNLKDMDREIEKLSADQHEHGSSWIRSVQESRHSTSDVKRCADEQDVCRGHDDAARSMR